ncbi:hypothetical protein HOP50_17g80970 [Chloropicon primus]|uniref:Uncharacterized protein n=1 Tax=Chloropicon primus TaxID=1764295 RepID=A0A5B8N0W0_9CHLO|nr:hypothetical protein A3770_17p80730 [Chloropicon primus]UPR04752.1 hypothetical protein HOP50_17g80970 [Chloropicon primus]|eukprot:QDZ25555.1 hypothetical protein A3770_17p80730 [Chloropicon primus]
MELKHRAHRWKSDAMGVLSRGALACSLVACAWGAVVLPWAAWTNPDWTRYSASSVVGVLALSLLVSPVASRMTERAAAPSRARVDGVGGSQSQSQYSTGLATLKALCMVFVMIIHSKCWKANFFYNHVVDRAVAMLFVAMGMTGLGASSKYKLVDRFSILLEPWYAFVLFNWTYRYVDGSGFIDHYNVMEHCTFWVSAVFGFAPCMGGAWFVFPMLQLLVIIQLLKNRERLIGALVPPMVAVASLSREVLDTEIHGLTERMTSSVAMDCNMYNSVYTLTWWHRWVGYTLIGMWLSTFRKRIKRWEWSVPLAAFAMIVSAVMDRIHWRKHPGGCEPCRQHIWEILNHIAGSALALAIVLFFDHFQWLSVIRWMGDCSWTVYLGQITALNLLKRDACALVSSFQHKSKQILYVETLVFLGWIFSKLFARKKMTKAKGKAGL